MRSPFKSNSIFITRVLILVLFIAVLLSACNTSGNSESQINDNTKFVNTFIGTGGYGHTFPGATTQYGMVQLSPDTCIFIDRLHRRTSFNSL